jgi:hypothetical protein
LDVLQAERDFEITFGPNYSLVIAGALTTAFGLGLALHIEFVRGIANVVSFVKLIFALLGLGLGLMGTMIFGAMTIPFILIAIANVLSAGMMIWLIGETDVRTADV